MKMPNNLIAKASVTIHAPLVKVWDALVNPEIIRKYMFGTTVVSDWRVGDPILWQGEWQGKRYEDRGVILQIKPGSRLQYSHFSPLSGLPDQPENYHTITMEVSSTGKITMVTLSQDKNPTEREQLESEKNWEMVLTGMKKLLEE
jgi:uncharacterized protein YndB with AHSA1/START domain